MRLDVIRPYIAFRCEVEEAGELARLLRKDAESDDPKLHWGWSITGSFDKDFTLSYRLSTDNPWRFYYRYWRPSLDHDMAVIAQMLIAAPVCKGLVDFHYDPTSGTRHFILPNTSLFPAGRHSVRYPLPKIVTQRTVYRWQDSVRDETHTHIATGAHGFESLCCSEMLAEMVEKAEISADGKVTCPLCKIIWQDCRAFEPCDFSDGEQQQAAMPEVPA